MDTGMVRRIDDLGRIVVPVETRRLFKIREGDEIAITVENNGIVLRKLDATCTFCGATENVRPFHDKGVCNSCRGALNR